MSDSRYPDDVFERVIYILGKLDRATHPPPGLHHAMEAVLMDPDDDAIDAARHMAAGAFVRIDRHKATVFAGVVA